MRRAVLEVGGTHVTAAIVGGACVLESHRCSIDSAASADVLVDQFIGAVEGLGTDAAGLPLVVAIPGPFDYDRGIGDFEGVAKFGALAGVPVGDLLRARLGVEVAFVNDVTAYALGQSVLLGHPRRLVCLTLGTGVGSAFLADGAPVTDDPDVPEQGWVYLLTHEGKPLEETFSRRALLAAHAAAAGSAPEGDVREIFDLARAGEAEASRILSHGFRALALTVAPWVIRFGTTAMVLGGSMAGSWDLVTRWFTPVLLEQFRLAGAPAPDVVAGRDGEHSALIGAASSHPR